MKGLVLIIQKENVREAFKKKNCVFCDIGPKGGWVPVSKHNFFYLRNYDIYQRWVGFKHRCHNFIYSKFTFELSTLPLKKCINCLFNDPYPWLHGIRAENDNVLLMSRDLMPNLSL